MVTEMTNKKLSDFGELHAPNRGVAFIVFGANTQSGLVVKTGRTEPSASVMVKLAGKWAKAAQDELTLYLDADLAAEIGQHLIESSKAAESDLKRFNK